MWLYSPSASPDVWRPDDCEPRPELCIDDRDPPASADVALSTCTSPMSTAVEQRVHDDLHRRHR